ncbi:MAG: IS200/IS605 family transposase, partial [Actinomycetaceae bacterium]|nr:IS200/IS605 family transposase [Actinomycetaceae bacterium]
MEDVHRGRGCAYRLQYHVVWCTKYRRKALVGAVRDAAIAKLLEIARSQGTRIVAHEVMPDHIHILIDCAPQHYLPRIVQTFKGSLAFSLFHEYNHLRAIFRRGHLWNPSYFVATVSENTSE